MTTLTVQGRLDSAPANTDLAKQTSPDLVVTPKYSPQLQIARAGVPLHPTFRTLTRNSLIFSIKFLIPNSGMEFNDEISKTY